MARMTKDNNSDFSELWTSSRYASGVSQEYMAERLNVSKKTIQNWEKGESSPSMWQGFEWFRVLGINPLRYFLNYIYPEAFSDLTSENSDKEVKEALIEYISNATPTEHRQLLFLIAGEHGSDWYGLLQMMTAHCHTSMQSRVAAARTILDNYHIEEANGKLIQPEHILPDIDILERSINGGKEAAKQGSAGYSILE